MNNILLSTATLPQAHGKPCTVYSEIKHVSTMLNNKTLEFVILPEWDPTRIPLTKSSVDWYTTDKPSYQQLKEQLLGLDIVSIHLNRDIGNYLSASNSEMMARGLDLLIENLNFATELQAKHVVMHLWDTYAKCIDIKSLWELVLPVLRNYTHLLITIENTPISDPNLSHMEAFQILDQIMDENHGFTLDMKWSSLYDNFYILYDGFKDRIKNIHIHGSYLDDVDAIVSLTGDLDYSKALGKLTNYQGYITLELENVKNIGCFEKAIKFINRIL